MKIKILYSNAKRYSYHKKTSKRYTSIRKAKKAYKKTYKHFLDGSKVKTMFNMNIKHRNKNILYRVYFAGIEQRMPYIE